MRFAIRFAATCLVVGLGFCTAAFAQDQAKDEAVDRTAIGVQQLRHAHGLWNTTTEFLNEDGSVARKVEGTYRFEWVIPDRVLQGRSEIPEQKQVSAILFYVRENKEEIEMVSVGPDGRLWVMTGPIDGEVRSTPDLPTRDGGTLRLRFTRYAVTQDGFESKMEYSSDQGKTWVPGNHQVFVRAAAEPKR